MRRPGPAPSATERDNGNAVEEWARTGSDSEASSSPNKGRKCVHRYRHKTESVYRRYAIADKAAQEEGVEKLARLLDARTEPRKTVSIQEATGL
jgi:hypothetical protein